MDSRANFYQFSLAPHHEYRRVFETDVALELDPVERMHPDWRYQSTKPLLQFLPQDWQPERIHLVRHIQGWFGPKLNSQCQYFLARLKNL